MTASFYLDTVVPTCECVLFNTCCYSAVSQSTRQGPSVKSLHFCVEIYNNHIRNTRSCD